MKECASVVFIIKFHPIELNKTSSPGGSIIAVGGGGGGQLLVMPLVLAVVSGVCQNRVRNHLTIIGWMLGAGETNAKR